MTSLERYNSILRGDSVDFLPRLPILMQYAAEHIGSNYGAFASDHRVLVESNFSCARDFGMDQLSVISDPYRETHGFGGAVHYVTDGVPRCPHPPLAASKDLDSLPQPDPLAEGGRMLDRVEAVRLFKARDRGEHSILGWIEGPAAEAADLRTVMNFLIDLMDDEPFCEALMDRCVAAGIRFAKAQVASGADTVGIGDAIASQVSPDQYERLIQPREKQLVEAVHSFGARVRLHICGNITGLLPGIADLGVDILDVDHMVDMRRARQVVGNGVTLCGNIDPAAGVASGDPQSIRETVLRTYEAVGNPFMVGAGCEIPSGTPSANLRALCEPVPWRG